MSTEECEAETQVEERTPLHILRRQAPQFTDFGIYGWVKGATRPTPPSDLDRIEGAYEWDWISE